MIEWHAIFKEGGKVKDCCFRAPPELEEAEREFLKLHPDATYWELGRPLVWVTLQ